jgi:hypothetical protein
MTLLEATNVQQTTSFYQECDFSPVASPSPLPTSPLKEAVAEVAATILQSVLPDGPGIILMRKEEESTGVCVLAHDEEVDGTQIEEKNSPHNRIEEENATVASARGEEKKEVTLSSAEGEEKAFVVEKREFISGILEKWRKDYYPAPAFVLSWIPAVNRIVEKESFDVVNTFVEKLSKVSTRQRLAALLQKNANVLKESMFCMNSATESKMKEACAMIEKELQELGDVGVASKHEVKKAPLTIAADDPLYTEKSRLMKKLDDWKIDFDPQPLYILSYVAGVTESVSKKAERLFHVLFKGIVRASTKEGLMKILDVSSSLMSDYSTFVNPSTAVKLTAACESLSKEKEILAATV